MFKLYLDPGHGGSDSGSRGNKLNEKDIALDIALRIRDILINEYEEVTVKMSRSTDVFRTLKERTDEANSWGAHYFLSIHVNSYTDQQAHGYEDYIYSGLSDSSVTARHQTLMHQEIMKMNGLLDRGKKKADFYVLRETNMGAILTENGFITNKDNAAKLADPNWRNKVARGHVNGLEKAFSLKRKAVEDVHRVIVDGVQIGAYASNEKVLSEVNRHLKTAKRIVIEKL